MTDFFGDGDWNLFPDWDEQNLDEPSEEGLAQKRARVASEELSQSTADLFAGIIKCRDELDSVTAHVLSVTVESDHRDGANARLLRRDPAQVTYTYRVDAPNGQPHTQNLSNTTFNSTYGDPAGTYAKPDYQYDPNTTIVTSYPVSHTRAQHMTITVVIRVNVPLTVHSILSVTRITGTPLGNTAGLDFDLDLSAAPVQLAAGDNDLTHQIQSTRALPSAFRILQETFGWTVHVHGGNFTQRDCDAAASTHEVLVTFDTPGGQVQWIQVQHNGRFDLTGGPQAITYSRLSWAIRAVVAQRANVQNFTDTREKDYVDAIFFAFSAAQVDYALGYRWGGNPDTTFLENRANGNALPTLHEYLWLCATNDARGECHNIAVAFILVCQAIGAQQPFDVGFMWPWPSRVDDPVHRYPRTRNDPGPHLVRNQARPYAGAADDYTPSIKGKYSVDDSARCKRTSTRSVYDNSNSYQVCAFLDTYDNGNNFEGAARYDNRHLYAIGDVILDTETSSDLNACVYYTRHVNVGGRVTRVYANGKFRLYFCDKETNVRDTTPYLCSDGTDAIAYDVTDPGGTKAFFWHQ